MPIIGKRKQRSERAQQMMEALCNQATASQPTPLPPGRVPPRAPPLLIRPPFIPSDTTSTIGATTGTTEASSTSASETSRPIPSARCKAKAPTTAPAPKKKRGLCFGKKAEDIIQQTGQKIKLEYCPRVKGPSMRGINSWVAHDIDCAIRSLVGMRVRMFYDLDQTEKWKVWNAMTGLSLANKRNRREKTMHHHTGSSPIIYTIKELKIQGEQIPIIKGFEKTYVMEGDEVTTKHYQLQEVHERYEQRLKESEERAQQQIQEVKQHALRAKSMYSAM
ncbi:hypothetical protein ACLB2K_003975 [Fragaria x ananassa]